MLGLSRRIPLAHEAMKRGEWAKRNMIGRSLTGKVLGIVGFGSVGKELARLADAFGMEVFIAAAQRSRPSAHSAPPSDSEMADSPSLPPRVALEDLLSKSDFVSLHVPLTPETDGMIGTRELALMKPSAVVVNSARGGVVDERAVLKALEEGRLGGAALDVFVSEKAPLEEHVISLCRLPNVICTPHIGGSTVEAGERVLTEVCNAVLEALRGTIPADRIVNGNPDTRVRLARLRVGASESDGG